MTSVEVAYDGGPPAEQKNVARNELFTGSAFLSSCAAGPLFLSA
jgi:hypothetical protein